MKSFIGIEGGQMLWLVLFSFFLDIFVPVDFHFQKMLFQLLFLELLTHEWVGKRIVVLELSPQKLHFVVNG